MSDIPKPSRREREEALIAEVRGDIAAYDNGTENKDGFVPYDLHEAITGSDVSLLLDALAASHRREDAIRAFCAELSANHEKPFPTKGGAIAERLLAILDGDEGKT